MLRAILLYLSRAAWAQQVIHNWGLARRVARRFVAGETLDEAVEVIQALNQRGITATVAVLGESVADARQARAAAGACLRLIDAIRQGGLDAWVSVKLTALGLDIDPALCRASLRAILGAAQAAGLCVTIDMEDHPYAQATLDLFHALRGEDGFENVRVVIQSYLYRSDDDVAELAAQGAGVRLVKGAYKEPASIAYPHKREVDAAFVRHMKILLDAARQGRGYPGLATHDAAIIEQAKAYAEQQGLPRHRYEFQMLFGVRTALQEELVAQSYGLRVYVPYGTHWYPYLMRRLAERPANLWFFVRHFFRR